MIKNGKIWPVIIAASIFGVVLLCYWTIKQTFQADLTQSDMYMSNYQNVDENINDIILKKINFNKKFNLKLQSFNLQKDGSVVYSITDKHGNGVNNAILSLVFSRPSNDAKDIILKPAKMVNGIYTFEKIDLPKEGRWDLMLHVKIGDQERYYNLKADTRSKKIKEY